MADQDMQEVDEAPAVAPQRMNPSDPMAQAAQYDAQRAGFINGLSPSSLNPQQQKQAQDMQMQLMQGAMSKLVPSHPNLRKLSHIVGNAISNAGLAVAGAGSGHGFEAARDMMQNARIQRNAEDQDAVNQLKAAHSIAQMNMDPKMISNILNGYTKGQQGAQKQAQILNQNNQATAKQDATNKKIQLSNARSMERNAIQQRLAGVAEGRLSIYGQNANEREAHDVAGEQNNANRTTNQGQQIKQQGEHFVRADQTAQGNMQANQSRAQAYGQDVSNRGTNMNNNAQRLGQTADFTQKMKHYQVALGALKSQADMYDRMRIKGILPEDEEENANQAHAAYKAMANEAYQESQPQSTPVQQQGAPQQEPAQASPQQQQPAAPVTQAQAPQRSQAAPASLSREQVPSNHLASPPPPVAVKNLANMARNIHASNPNLTPLQCAQMAKQYMSGGTGM